MATQHDGELLRDLPKGKPLTDVLPEGDLLTNEGPSGNPLWKKKKKLNEDDGSDNMLNE
jgi:hypothetical protein